MKRHRPLIASPLDWFLSANPVPPPAIPVLAERGGTQLKTPRPVLVVDTREQNPFDFSRFRGWFSGVERRALRLGDYSIAGLEDVCVVERKGSFLIWRARSPSSARFLWIAFGGCLAILTVCS